MNGSTASGCRTSTGCSAAGHDLPTLGRTVIQSFLKHAIRDGFFHADMHPGNLFVDAQGRLVAVDGGIMGRLGPKERRFLAEILLGFITRDYTRVAEVHFEAGYVPAHHAVADFAQAIRAVGEPIHDKSADQISMAKVLTLLFEITGLFDMATRTELVMLQKTMVVVEGVARTLDPHLDMWTTAEPVVRDWITRNLGPLGKLEDAGRGARSLALQPGRPARDDRPGRARARPARGQPRATASRWTSAAIAAIGRAEAQRNRWGNWALWVIAALIALACSAEREASGGLPARLRLLYASGNQRKSAAMRFETAATPDAAVDRLEALYEQAKAALRRRSPAFLRDRPAARRRRAQPRYRYPLLRVTYEPSQLPAATRRGYAKFAAPGVYSTTVTHPAEFRGLSARPAPAAGRRLRRDHRDRHQRAGDPLSLRARAAATSSGAARSRPPSWRGISRRRCSRWSATRSPTAPSTSSRASRGRCRCSMRCGSIIRCAGWCITPARDWRAVQPWVLLTNYHRYVDQFVRLGAGRDRGRHGAGAGDARRGADRARRRRCQRRRARDGGALAPLPDAGLSSDPRERAGRDADQYRRRPLQRQEHHRPSRGAAAQLLADGRPLRRPAADPDHRRLRAGPCLSAPGPHPRRAGAAGRADPGAGRGAGRAAGGGGRGHRREAATR